MIRFVFILLVAIALTISWQTTLLAGTGLDTPMNCAEAQSQDGNDKKPDSSSEEPECE